MARGVVSAGAVLGTAVMLVLAWQIVGKNFSVACHLRQWPVQSGCDPAPDHDAVATVTRLRRALQANPGDAESVAKLARLAATRNAPEGLQREALLAVASALTPQDPTVIRLRAQRAIRQKDWGRAVDLLVALRDVHLEFEGGEGLAALAEVGLGIDAMRRHVVRGALWLDFITEVLATQNRSFDALLPLISEGLKLGIVSERVLDLVYRRLRERGQWSDAYALWLQTTPSHTGLLANGDFESPLRANEAGFGWELVQGPASASGVAAQTLQAQGRGRVLQVVFNGRSAMMPVARQAVFLPPGRFRLTGMYRTDNLVTEHGLAWVARCPADGALVAQSAALLDTANRWTPFEMTITAPEKCGDVVYLQLETKAAYEAAAGLRGNAAFDAIALARMPG